MPHIDSVAHCLSAQRTASILPRRNFRVPCHHVPLWSLAKKVARNTGMDHVGMAGQSGEANQCHLGLNEIKSSHKEICNSPQKIYTLCVYIGSEQT